MNKRPQISCSTYGGKIGWFLRKHFSKYTSELYLLYQYTVRKKFYKKYIDFFMNKPEGIEPCLVSIETINRCNGECGFCPANKHNDKRPFAKMEEELFYKIINDLKKMNYSGYLNLYVNNEPFMDTRIEDWYKYAKEQLPNAKMLLYTNGTLISIERFEKIIPYIDKMIINNYSATLELHPKIADIYEYVRSNEKLWDKDIAIQIRYNQEILTNRAGDAPNKKGSTDKNQICIMPFTDITIYPDGTLGLCCSDALEKTNLGSVRDNYLADLWMGDTYRAIRNMLKSGRSNYPFCKQCDFFDAGIRNMFIENKLKCANKL